MAENLANVVYGLDNFVISIGAYVTAKGAGTLVDVGITEGGLEIDWGEDSLDIYADRHLGALSQEPIKRTATLKFVMKEVTPANALHIFGAVAGDSTGTPPNLTVEPGADNPAQYKQIQAVGHGQGSTKVRTYTFWRARRTGAVKLPQKKNEEQKWEVTYQLLQEITGAVPSSFFKFVDA